jgi:hypothetical protein
MLDDQDLLPALKRHWEYGGKDEDISHEIYHDDAVLEFPQSGERFEGVENFREWRRQYPAQLAFHTRRISHRDDLVVVETSSATTARPGCTPLTCSSSGATKSPTSGSTSWTAGNPPSSGHPGGPVTLRILRRLRRQTASSGLKPVCWNPNIE